MSADDDLYGLLGVPRAADADAIKAAWRDLARRLHPDRNPGDAAAATRFQRLSAAYAVLSDPDKRLVYDHLGLGAVREATVADLARTIRESATRGPSEGDRREAQRQREARAARAAERHVKREPRARTPFSGAPPPSQRASGPTHSSTVTLRPQRGADIRLDLAIYLREAARGGVHEVEVERSVACVACAGTGVRAGKRCATCRGDGQVSARVLIPIRVPVSVVTGTTVQIVGAGGVGTQGGENGDVYVRVVVRPDPVFRRENLNLHVDVPLTPAQAAAGGRYEVPTLGGTVLVDFPRNASQGQKVRVIGLGMPGSAGRSNGDLYATVRIHG